ncbi:hypothetical protein TNCV_3997441 [Trichonephila clavipes]|nr:hypothetical protein TNCV_3997441 [Trichonephila clavipes]
MMMESMRNCWPGLFEQHSQHSENFLILTIRPVKFFRPMSRQFILTFNRANVQSISTGFWNANGLRSKIHEVRYFVLEQNLDLFLVQETRTCNEHLDVAIGRLGENISEALVAASKPKFNTAPIKFPPDIHSKIRHRNRVRRFWQRSRDPALKSEVRTISNEIVSDIRHLSRARWEKTTEELSPETGTLWRRT